MTNGKTLVGLATWLVALGVLMVVAHEPGDRLRALAIYLPLGAAAYLLAHWLRRRRANGAQTVSEDDRLTYRRPER